MLNQSMYRQINNTSEQNRHRGVYPEGAAPRVIARGMPPAVALRITDTTFRDGQQAGEPFSLAAALALHDVLVRLDAGSGRIAQTELFLYADRDRALIEAIRETGARYPEPTAWIRADARDLGLVRAAGLAETGILCSASDHHIFGKLGWTRSEAFTRRRSSSSAASGVCRSSCACATRSGSGCRGARPRCPAACPGW